MVKGLTSSSIDWCQFGWPVVTGCKRKCSIDGKIYCYAYNSVVHGRLKGQANYNPDFSPKFNIRHLDAPAKRLKASTIFIAPLGELWGPWVPEGWQNMVMEQVRYAENHTFLSLTKYPEQLDKYQTYRRNERGDVWHFPENLWLGTTVDDVGAIKRLWHLQETDHPKRFVSFEPLLGDVAACKKFDLEGVGWVIIGGLSKGAVKVNPEAGHFMRLYAAAKRAGIPVFIKDNCTILSNPPKDFPEGFPEGFPK